MCVLFACRRQEDIRRLLAAHGAGFPSSIRISKDFNNPYSLEKVAAFFGIDNVGSCFPASTFDPHGFPEEDYYERLAGQQRLVVDAAAAPPPVPAPALAAPPGLAAAVAAMEAYVAANAGGSAVGGGGGSGGVPG